MIHPDARIDASAEIADDAEIGPFVIIGPHCIVGPRCVLHPFSRLASHVTLHEDVKIHSGAVIGDVPQHLGYKEHPGRVEIGARTILREHVTVHRPHVAGGVTRIGADCFLMVGSHVAHDCVLGNKVIFVNAATPAGHVTIGDGVLLSGHVGIHQFVSIGRMAMLSASAQVSMDVPPFVIVEGRNYLEGLNVVGLKRAGYSPAQRRQLKRVMLHSLQPGVIFAQAITRQRAELATLPADDTLLAGEFLDWLAADHPRGVLRFPGGAQKASPEAPEN